MRVVVRHGHFAFYPHARDEILHFARVFKQTLVAEDDYFTFANLAGLPRWSQVGGIYGTLVANATFEGRHSSQVMEANDFVYSLTTGFLVPTSTVSESVKMPQSRDFAIAPRPLVQPGALVSTNGAPNVLLGYQGELDLSIQKLYVCSLETLI